MKNNEKTTCEKLSGGGLEWYRKKIVNMVGNIQNEKHIKMIYGFVKRLYKE